MLNEHFKTMHLKQTKFITPLFENAMKACALSASELNHSAKYLVINSTCTLPSSIFQDAPALSPVYINGAKSYIFLEGECLWDYLRAKKESEIILTEEEIWGLLDQVVTALIRLREEGLEHKHFKEYALRRISSNSFRLIYHPEMASAEELIRRHNYYWYDFYFSPEELEGGSGKSDKSICFAIGAVLVNLMNPLDFKRDIYSKNKFSINHSVIQEKINHISYYYSSQLVELVRNCLEENHLNRISLHQLHNCIHSSSSPNKRKIITSQVIDYVAHKGTHHKRSTHNFTPKKWKMQPVSQSHKSQTESRFFHYKQASLSQEKSKFIYQEKQKKQQKEQKSPKAVMEQTQKTNMFDLAKLHVSQYEDKKDMTKQELKSEMRLPFERGTFGRLQNEEEEEEEERRSSMLDRENEVQPIFSKINALVENKQGHCVMENGMNFVGSPSHDVKDMSELDLQTCLQSETQLALVIGKPGVWIEGDIYYGDFQNGRRVGKGLEIFPHQKEYYFGYFQDDLFHGEGFYSWNQKEYFLGIFQNGQKVKGTLYGKIIYTGQFQHNRRHGFGKCFYENHSVYEGYWKSGKRHGEGILIEMTGDRFVGSFLNGKKHGQGSYFFDECQLSGVWECDQLKSPVQISYSNQCSYVGDFNWETFSKEGQGQYTFPNGSTYTGSFERDEFVKGEILYNNGERYNGQVLNNKRHGYGQYFYNNGQVFRGKWHIGKKADT